MPSLRILTLVVAAHLVVLTVTAPAQQVTPPQWLPEPWSPEVMSYEEALGLQPVSHRRTSPQGNYAPNAVGDSNVAGGHVPLNDLVPGQPVPQLPPQRSLRPPVTGTFTQIGSGGGAGLGISELDVSAIFRMPEPWTKGLVSITGGVDLQFLDGPTGVPLPSELYRVSVGVGWMKALGDDLRVIVQLTPSFNSDGENTSGDAFQLRALAAGIWQCHPDASLTFGALVTGRSDIPLIPAIGVIWTPTEDWRIEASAPRPRIARRTGLFGDPENDWLFVAGEFGGGTWAVQRAGVDDELNLSDFRFLLGWEKTHGRASVARFEAGYVFGREIEYESIGFSVTPSDTFLVRAGLTY